MLYVYAINESIHHPINKGKFYSTHNDCRKIDIIDFRYRTTYHSPLRFLRSEWINFNRPTNNTSLHLLHSKSTLYTIIYTPSTIGNNGEKARGRTRKCIRIRKRRVEARSVTRKRKGKKGIRKGKHNRRKNKRTLSSVTWKSHTRYTFPRDPWWQILPLLSSRTLYFHTLPFSPLFSLTSNGCNYSSKFLTG